jgi:putative heme iron utilization protein
MFIGEGVGVVPKVSQDTRIRLITKLMEQEDETALPALETVHTETMGKDTVMLCTLRPTKP